MKKIKIIASFILILLASFIFGFLLLFSICSTLNDFEIINAKTTFFSSVGLSFLISILVVVLIIVDANSKKTSKLVFLLRQQCPKLILSYVFPLLFSRSIRKEILWTAQEIAEVLSIIWTIFGLSITIFLVWNVLIVGYLKSKQPVEKKDSNLIEHYHYLISRNTFVQDTKTLFNTVVFLVINLFVILMATTSVYLSKSPESLLTQNITICAFYFSTNTLVFLFLDILKPLQKDRKALIDQNQISSTEFEMAEAGARLQINMETFVKLVNDSTFLTDEQKKEVIALFFKMITDCLKSDGQAESEDAASKTRK